MNYIERELLLRQLYETEKRLDERNFAKGHSFEEWVDFRFPKREKCK